MAFAVIMPRQGNTVESCIITAWKKKQGEAVQVGDVLFSYETDKAAFECEAEVAGTLLKVLYQEGDDVPCLENVCVIGQPGENPDSVLGGQAAAEPVTAAAPAESEKPVAIVAKADPAAAAGDCKPVIMPRQGNTVESCVINKWHKNVGDNVNVGDVLFSYETDKAAFDCEAEISGVMLARFFEEGDDVPCLENVCAIGKEGANAAAWAPGAAVEAEAAPAPEAQPAAAATRPEGVRPAQTGGNLKISPRARALAEKSGADLSWVTASGPDGRVIARDVQALIDEGKLVTPAARGVYAGGLTGTGLGGRVTLSDLEKAVAAKPESPAVVPVAASAPAAAAKEEPGVPVDDSYTEPMTNMRKVIARAMTQSLGTMAQLTHNISYDATEVKKTRAMFKAKGEPYGMDRISINDIIMYAVARTLADPAHRALNANLIDDGKTMKYFNGVHLGMAVDTDRGLMVPTIFNADKMTLKQLSDTAKKLAKECKEGKINPDYLTGGSFTVSNLGVYGIESFTPVINPPQTGILGVCAMKDAFRVENGEIKVYPSMSLSLSYDHRALDGSPASKFLVDLKANLENFALLLARG
ncbi:MAG: 2-oxo acid dehydrogenase subunit E2 [Christensenellales bacterium]|nr:2-oxo acid dehydrogenase subunit E2 [Christensenellales bacterium]